MARRSGRWLRGQCPFQNAASYGCRQRSTTAAGCRASGARSVDSAWHMAMGHEPDRSGVVRPSSQSGRAIALGEIHIALGQKSRGARRRPAADQARPGSLIAPCFRAVSSASDPPRLGPVQFVADRGRTSGGRQDTRSRRSRSKAARQPILSVSRRNQRGLSEAARQPPRIPDCDRWRMTRPSLAGGLTIANTGPRMPVRQRVTPAAQSNPARSRPISLSSAAPGRPRAAAHGTRSYRRRVMPPPKAIPRRGPGPVGAHRSALGPQRRPVSARRRAFSLSPGCPMATAGSGSRSSQVRQRRRPKTSTQDNAAERVRPGRRRISVCRRAAA